MRDINQHHPEYDAELDVWGRYSDLYLGGEKFRKSAGSYLVQRRQEPREVYAERLQRVFYENYIGSIIDWYSATLFRREPLIGFEGSDELGRKFFAGLTEDCDKKQTRLCDFFRKQFVDALVFGRSYLLVDFPRQLKQAGSRAEEEATGTARAYLVEYQADQVINWERDEHGAYEWVVLQTTGTRRDETGQFYTEERWTYYDRQRFERYRRESKAGKPNRIELVEEGLHALARESQVPLFEMKVPDGLWLMNKAGLLQLEHFNKSNALAWALTMGLFAMPVVYSDKDMDQVMGESYYIQLGPQDRFGWTEPAGHVYEVASNNLTRLQEEIYRVCYLLTLGGNSAGNASSQSGVSKQRDFALTQEVLRTYGDVVKSGIKRVLRAIAAARQDDLLIDVTGRDEFDIGDFAAELQNAQALLGMQIGSPTLTEQIYKRLAYQYLGDFRQELKEQVAREIKESNLLKGGQ